MQDQNPVSAIGRLSARNRISGKRSLLIALRSYLDGSGNPSGNYLTLAAVVSTDEIWRKFEDEWRQILDGHSPKASYIHMKEIASGESEEFSWRRKWNETKRHALVTKCMILMSHMDKRRFWMVYCAVDLAARRKLVNEGYAIPDGVDLCLQFCPEIIPQWYLKQYPDLIDPASDTLEYFFDSSECFKAPFEERWNAERKAAESSGQRSVWQQIIQVGAVEMKKTIGVQAADIIAWSVNREAVKEAGAKGKHLAHILRQVVPSGHIVFDESTMRKKFRPLIYRPRWF